MEREEEEGEKRDGRRKDAGGTKNGRGGGDGHYPLIAGVAGANQFQQVHDQSYPASIMHIHTHGRRGKLINYRGIWESNKREAKRAKQSKINRRRNKGREVT